MTNIYLGAGAINCSCCPDIPSCRYMPDQSADIYKPYPITPMGAPRMTRADAWRSPPREVVSRYWAFKDLLKAHQVELRNGDGVVFVLPMPVSWSKKKKAQMCGQWCQSKPDLDNLLKALMDALFLDDAHIAELSKLRKEWGYTGEIRIYHG